MITIDLSKIAYLAPVLPRFEVSNRELFWQWWKEVNIPIKRITSDSRGNGGGYNGEFWDGVTIWQKEDYQKNIVWKVNFQPNDELFSGFIGQLLDALPWYDIHGVTLGSNKDKVGPHRDGLPRDPFPSAPRIMLMDECQNRTFYLVHQQPFKMFHPDLRNGPNLFYFNNEYFLHGTAAPKGGRKILARIDGPLVDAAGFVDHLVEQAKNGAKYEAIAS